MLDFTQFRRLSRKEQTIINGGTLPDTKNHSAGDCKNFIALNAMPEPGRYCKS